MLTKHKVTVAADTIVNDSVIATHAAIITVDTGKVQFGHRHVNEAACEEFRDIVRSDRAEFEDFAYDLKNTIRSMLIAEPAPIANPEDIAE